MPSLLSCKHGHTWLRKANTQKSREKHMQYSRKPSVLPPWRSHEEVVWPKPNYLSHQRNKTNNKHIALPLISYLRTAELARWWAAPRNLLEDEVRRMSSQLWGKLKGFSMGQKGRIESHQDKMHLNASKCLTGARDLELRDGPSCLISWSGHKASSFPVTSLICQQQNPGYLSPWPLMSGIFFAKSRQKWQSHWDSSWIPWITNSSFLPELSGLLERGTKAGYRGSCTKSIEINS